METRMLMMTASAASSIAAAVWMEFQAGQSAPGGTPAAAPRQTNPQPRPVQPGNPVQPANTQPNQPVNPNAPVTTQPGQVNPAVQPGQVNPGVDNRYARPFVFQSPAYEARFNDNARRLVAMEQRLNRDNQELMRRLGEARALTGERQTAAVYDILQQMLKDQAATNQYLVRSRTAWTGDLEGTIPLEEDVWTTGQPANPANTTQPAGGSNQSPTGTTNPPR